MAEFLGHVPNDHRLHQLHNLYGFQPMPVGCDMGENMASPPRFCRHVWMLGPYSLAEHQGGQAAQTLNVPMRGYFEG